MGCNLRALFTLRVTKPERRLGFAAAWCDVSHEHHKAHGRQAQFGHIQQVRAAEHFAPPFGKRTATYSKRRDGTWVGQATPPVGVAGFATVRAYCWSADRSRIWYAYPRTYRITISTPYTLNVSPSKTVTPGTTLTIQPAHGSFCSSIDSGYIALAPRPYSYILGSTSWPVPAQFFGIPRNISASVTNENWTATLRVPSTLASGRYYLLAACGYSRTTEPGMFEPTPIKVEAPR